MLSAVSIWCYMYVYSYICMHATLLISIFLRVLLGLASVGYWLYMFFYVVLWCHVCGAPTFIFDDFMQKQCLRALVCLVSSLFMCICMFLDFCFGVHDLLICSLPCVEPKIHWAWPRISLWNLIDTRSYEIHGDACESLLSTSSLWWHGSARKRELQPHGTHWVLHHYSGKAVHASVNCSHTVWRVWYFFVLTYASFCVFHIP
jgi:hypothetical protein